MHLHQLRLTALLVAAPLMAQADLYVGGNRPGAYPDIASAYAAAAPGDRILIDSTLSNLGLPIITKSVTFEAVSPSGISLSNFGGPWGPTGPTQTRTIQQLTPGIPLVFRRLHFGFFFMTMMPASFGTASPLVGSIQFEGCSFTFPSALLADAPTMVDLTVTDAQFRSCQFTMSTPPGDMLCFDTPMFLAGGCLRVTGQRLFMEDCTLRAASGAYLQSAPNNCYFGCPSIGPAYSRNSPQGGFALIADTQETWLVRTRTSDGNGGGADPATIPCGTFGIPAPAGQSIFTSATGSLHAFDSVHEVGRHGQIYLHPNSPRGPLVNLGDPTAPLRLSGNAQLGGGIQASVTETGISLLAMAFAWSPTNTPVGRIAFDPLQEHFTFLVFTPTPPSTQSWNVPNDPFLSGLPIVTQLFPFDPTNGAWRAANPSALTLRRP